MLSFKLCAYMCMYMHVSGMCWCTHTQYIHMHACTYIQRPRRLCPYPFWFFFCNTSLLSISFFLLHWHDEWAYMYPLMARRWGMIRGVCNFFGELESTQMISIMAETNWDSDNVIVIVTVSDSQCKRGSVARGWDSTNRRRWGGGRSSLAGSSRKSWKTWSGGGGGSSWCRATGSSGRRRGRLQWRSELRA